MFIKLFLIGFSIFLAIDLVWLSVISKDFYSQNLGTLMSTDVNLIPAIIFYILFIVGLVILVIIPALKSKSLKKAVLTGALFGLVSYATYDLTNLATLKDWPLIVTIVDLVWGTLLAATVSGVTYLVAKKFGLEGDH